MDKAILKKYDKAIVANNDLEPILRFYHDVLKEQIKVANKQPKPEETPTEAEVKQALLQGRVVVQEWPVPVNYEQMEDIFAKLGDILVEYQPQNGEKVREIIGVEWDFPILVKEFVSQDLSPVLKRAKDSGVDETVFSFLFINALRPFYVAYAEAVRWLVVDDDWAKPHCPVCGQLGQIAKLEGEGGKRHLYCALCDTVWKYKRLECLYCGAGHEDLNFLEVEESKYQIDVCQHCKGYIKTLDARELTTAPYMFLEDILTMELDLLAQREGYSKSPTAVEQ